MIDNILVTGASGLVGSAVVRKLQKLGCTSIITPSHNDLDLLKFQDVVNFMSTHIVDYVVHCAGSVAGIIGNSRDNYGQLYKNLVMGMNVIEAFRQSIQCNPNHFKKIMFLGSTCIYPKNAIQPIKESSLLTSELESTNEGYALAKISCIKACEYLNKSKQFNGRFLTCMPTNVYGPNDKYDPSVSHVFPALVKKICDAKKSNSRTVKIGGDGTPVRSFIFSDDLADAIVFLLTKYSGSEHVNVGCSKPITIMELARKISEVAEYSGDFEFDTSIPNGTSVKIEDNSLLLSLGWKPSVNLEDGIKITIEDYVQNYSND